MNCLSSTWVSTIAFAISLLFHSCGCSTYEDEFEYLPNDHDFVTDKAEISFQNTLGDIATLKVGEVICGMGDPEDFCEPQCRRTSFETCGQGVAQSLDESFVLDFSHSRKAWHDEIFYFSDCFFSTKAAPVLDTLDSLEVNSTMYYTVWKIIPTPVGKTASIAEFYYLDQTGPIKYVLNTGEIWSRIP